MLEACQQDEQGDQLARLGSNESCSSGNDPSGASSGEIVNAHGSDFADWTYKNIDLLRDRNREMAEQLAGLRT